jgi:hypothetical protein
LHRCNELIGSLPIPGAVSVDEGAFMFRRFITAAAMFALVLPTLAAAEPPRGGKPPPGRPAGTTRPAFTPHAPVHGPVGGPRYSGPRGPQFTYRGRAFNRVHLSPFIYPSGWGYRRWGIGMFLPPLFLAPAYYYADWGGMGLPPPDPGFQWVRYGPDLLLVNISTGAVVDVIYGAFN